MSQGDFEHNQQVIDITNMSEVNWHSKTSKETREEKSG
jgi:hypothetical protein